MTNIFIKILTTPRLVIDKKSFLHHPKPYSTIQALPTKVIKSFRKSLAIRVVTAGSSNAVEQELVALGNTFYDVERFGIHFVASPRHADMLLVTGPVSRNMREALVRSFEAMPDPRMVVTAGDDALDGGIFSDSYAVCNGAQQVIPVNYHIPGDPPSPRQIITAILAILNDEEGESRNAHA